MSIYDKLYLIFISNVERQKLINDDYTKKSKIKNLLDKIICSDLNLIEYLKIKRFVEYIVIRNLYNDDDFKKEIDSLKSYMVDNNIFNGIDLINESTPIYNKIKAHFT